MKMCVCVDMHIVSIHIYIYICIDWCVEYGAWCICWCERNRNWFIRCQYVHLHIDQTYRQKTNTAKKIYNFFWISKDGNHLQMNNKIERANKQMNILIDRVANKHIN